VRIISAGDALKHIAEEKTTLEIAVGKEDPLALVVL
jgi:hypothetical protein